MGVSKKGRRSIKYKDQSFVWWVGKNEDDCDAVWLNIISDDKSIVLSYKVGDKDFAIISKGRSFQGNRRAGCYERYLCPLEEPPMMITPKFVYELIAWAVDGRSAVIVNDK